MAETRQVTIHLDSTQQTEFREITGADEFRNAIGYMATWNMSYPVVEIYPDRDAPDLVAVYRREDGTTGYVIGAVWHADDSSGGHYGFHS